MSISYQLPAFDAPIDLDLSRNEGSPVITDVGLSSEALGTITSRYPDTSGLTDLVARRHRLPVAWVVVTAGGDDALLRCFLANRARPVVTTTPTFEMIRRYAAQVGSPLIEVPWWEGDFPVDELIEAGAAEQAVAVIVSPNNPTGNVIRRADLRRVAGAYTLVVLDAAYAEFAADDLTEEALRLDNVVVVRTLSKAFGLAGLRVGYLLGSGDQVGRIGTFGSPYAIAALSAVLAIRVLSREVRSAERYAWRVARNRERLTALLNDLGCRPLPSQGNFVLATDVDPEWLVPAAASLGVALRRFKDRPELRRCVRITVPGDGESYRRLVETLCTALVPEALLFDMDGVIADVRESYRAAIVATAATFGVTVTGADIAAAKARGGASDDWEVTRGLCADAGVDAPYEEVQERFESIYHGDGAAEGLKTKERLLLAPSDIETWARRLPLGIVTARPRRDAVELLDRFGIGRFFRAVVTREDAPSKPDPAPVRLALERLKVTRAWMFGDAVDDLRAARDAGVIPVGVAVAGEDQRALRGAARVLGSACEIREVIDAAKC